MESSVLRLLVFATIAAALIYIILGYFSGPAENEGQFTKGLDYAEGIQGPSHNYTMTLQKDAGFSAAALDTGTRSVRFRCSSADTCYSPRLSISPRILKVNEGTVAEAYFRCVRKETINDCVIYFGAAPAQLELTDVQAPGAARKGEISEIRFVASNNGALNAIGASYSIDIYVERAEDGERRQVLAEELRGAIQELSPGESHGIVAEFIPAEAGAHTAKITISGEDSGSAYSEAEFTASDSISSACMTAERGQASLEGGTCRVRFACTGCGFGAECKIKWIGEGLGESTIKESYPDGVYSEYPAIDGQCQ